MPRLTDNRDSGKATLALVLSVPVIVSLLSSLCCNRFRSPISSVRSPIKTSEDYPRGREVFYERGCSHCHSLDGGGQRRFGPPLHEIGQVARDRKPGMTASQYILESILDPSGFRAPGVAGGMPEGFMFYGKDDLRQLVGFLAAQGAPVRGSEIDDLKVPAIVNRRVSHERLDYRQVKRGEAIFRGKGQCITCHPLRPGPGSHLMGPSLLSVGSLGADDLRHAIEEPGARIAAGYQHIIAQRKDGRFVDGRLIEMADAGVYLLRTELTGDLVTDYVPFCAMECADDQTTPVYALGKTSMMPDVKQVLTPDEIDAVVAFLRNRHGNR
jgi:cytochrome c2